MLRVLIEIVPYGDETRKRTINQITLGLDPDSPLPQIGNYNVLVMEERFNGGNLGLFETDSFRVEDHKRSDGALELVRRALEVACGIGREDA